MMCRYYLKMAFAFFCVANVLATPLVGQMSKQDALNDSHCRGHCRWVKNTRSCIKKCVDNYCGLRCKYSAPCYTACIMQKR